ncbi:hypothetical protein [Marinicella sp. W31]|uniref:hypothetical protein n=1 Tax=Marinicella sp. W31 TaxID=3023713 RepID=UPI00375811CF
MISLTAPAAAATFDIGTTNWSGSFPGQGSYNRTVDNINVNATAERIVVINGGDPFAVFSGNDSPAEPRTYTYNFPPGADVSIDFFQISLNSTSNPEAVGNFNPPPDNINLGIGHSFDVNDNAIVGTAQADVNAVTTLSWSGVNSVSFDIASNGNVALIGHRNLVVNAEIAPRAVPILPPMALVLLSLAFFTAALNYYKRQRAQAQVS